MLLCYVDHHDRAYDWAERRKLETHPRTGAAQLVEIRETVKEVVVPVYVQTEFPLVPAPSTAKPLLFAAVADDELLGYGVPVEWLNDVKAANEDTLLIVADHLPAEAAEALLELATGGRPRVPRLAAPSETPFEHPDALRRFRVMANVEELERALEFPWEKWTVFLHPDQQEMVAREYAGPARVSGSAGTGKTIVALHRATHLARTYPNGRVLLTTFSDTLASALRTKLKRLLASEPRLAERIDVYSLDAIGMRLYKAHVGLASIAERKVVGDLIREAAGWLVATSSRSISCSRNGNRWLISGSWRTGKSIGTSSRLGRKTRLPEPQRKTLWSIFERVRSGLQSRRLITHAELFTSLAAAIAKARKIVFDFVVIDEAQDVTVSHIRLLAALGDGRPNSLFFAGDLGQRIFQQPFSWKALGVDIRGRSRTLRVNYRTSHQIRTQADRLLGPVVTDVDGNEENWSDTISVFNGPPPEIRVFKSKDEEIAAVGKWIAEHGKAGLAPHEVGLFVRSADQLSSRPGCRRDGRRGFQDP